MNERIIHLVAYGAPPMAGPNLAVAQANATAREEHSRHWPAAIVAMTNESKTLCGLNTTRSRESSQLVWVAFDSASQAPRDQLCTDCLTAATDAGKPLPIPTPSS